jgi:Delta3-Delta2-enoyl-CoA isomerase
MASNDHILLTFDGPIAIITLNQPKSLNALTQSDYFNLAQTLRKIATMDEILVTVLTGKGRFFSA